MRDVPKLQHMSRVSRSAALRPSSASRGGKIVWLEAVLQSQSELVDVIYDALLTDYSKSKLLWGSQEELGF